MTKIENSVDLKNNANTVHYGQIVYRVCFYCATACVAAVIAHLSVNCSFNDQTYFSQTDRDSIEQHIS